MSKYDIMTVLINHRKSEATQVQHLLTKYGCNIKMRLGLHETTNVFADDGLLILQLDGAQSDIEALEKGLGEVPGVEVKRITIGS